MFTLAFIFVIIPINFTFVYYFRKTVSFNITMLLLHYFTKSNNETTLLPNHNFTRLCYLFQKKANMNS